jgi:type II secretory pathway predicted ATPase ExeA/outer membrane protein OmpA-like peptidoglycan-associated protein
MYTAFYKLNAKPFQISSDPAFIWLGEKHKEALATLKYSVIDNKGLMLLTGDVGTGKTTLINTLLESLGNDVHFASVPDPRLNLIDFLNYIAQAFHIDGEFKSKGAFLLHFGWFLESVYKQKKKVLLIIDEAQLLTQDLLEEIRLLSNINRDGNHLLNIFFVGQNEFNEILHRPENRAVTQRITLNYQIHPLSMEETELYIRHRLKVAGASRPLFSTAAIEDISIHSEGIPRRINVICDHCLLTGYIEEESVISSKIVSECIKDIAIPRNTKKPQKEGKDGQQQSRIEEIKPSLLKGRRMALVLIPAVALFIMMAVLVSPSLNVSGKLVSTYQSVARALWGKTSSTQAEQQQEGEGKLSMQTETLLTDSAETKEITERLAIEKKPIQTDFQAGIPNEEKNAPENSVGENSVESTGLIEAGTAEMEDLPAGLTSIEIDANIYEAGATVEKTEKRSTGENVETATASDMLELPGTASPLSVPEGPALTQEQRSSEQPGTVAEGSVLGVGEESVIITFPRNSNDFSTSNLDQLIRLGLSIRDRDTVSLKISGYTDSSGSEEYNNRLSLIRATMVKSYLLGLGIHPNRLEVYGLGSQNPIADNATEKGKQRNRRVEVEVINP